MLAVRSEPEQTDGQIVGGRFQVERLLGRGGMGSVYLVRDTSGGQRLALKRLHRELTGRHAELFEREYRTLAGLRHPRIVQVYQYGVDADGAFYTMELLLGRDLSQCAPMGWREVCACLRDAASVLGVLHARRLVHRDLSPRNLWQTSDGRLRLLDFGALAPFGVTSETVGTPSFIAPEAVSGQALDGRADLFALGALGYWLLTSTPAFRANTLGELPRVWQKVPAPPSSLARLVPSAASDIPPALDQLILSLLRINADERPRNTADVVDRLNSIAGLQPEADDVIAQGYLESSAFVGRVHERERFSQTLARAGRGKPQALLIQGPEGSGRTRLLAELETAAHIAGATVVSAGASTDARPYETACALARRLLTVLPQQARAAAEAHAPVLASLLPELNFPAAAREGEATEERSRRQAAMRDWFLALARERTLVVLADDLQASDEESQALLASLARTEPGYRLLVVCALRADAPESQRRGAREFAAGARTLSLAPLELSELRELLRSVFGEVSYLERLAARLHHISGGSPEHTLMLARHLVRCGAARYADGSWTLPADLPEGLPSTLQASLLAALENMPADARELVRLASLPDHGPLTRATLAALARMEPARSEPALALLLEQRLLLESEAGLSLAHPALAEVLRAELTPESSERARLLLAEHLAGSHDLLSQVRCALHMLHAGRVEAAEARLLAASRRIVAGEHELLRACAPAFAEALALLRAAGRDDYVQLPLLNVLAISGYQVDRVYAVRYGDAALRAAQCVLRFDLARSLRPLLGGLLSLLVALAIASLSARLRRSKLGTLEVAGWLVVVTGYLMGPASLCLDREKLLSYAKVLEPLLALGKDHAVSHVHKFCRALALTLEDRCSAAPRLLEGLIARLNEPAPIRALPERNRRNLLASALYAYGLRETFACDPHLLVTADWLEQFSAMHAMQADQLRALYFSHLGEMSRAESYEHRLELRAVQLGTGWQAELLAPRHRARIALWTHDVASNGRAARALAALVQELPSFTSYERRARAVDLYLRGKYEHALPLLEVAEEPLERLGWTSMRALLASTYCELGEPAKAREVCLDALARLDDRDRHYVIMCLPIEIELALADSALGQGLAADQRLLALQQLHAGKGALVEGYLCRARVRVALLAGNEELAEQQLARLEQLYQPTRVPSLLIMSAELRDALNRLRRPSTGTDVELSADDAHLLTRVELMMTSTRDRADRAGAALQVALDLSQADRGFILYPNEREPAVWLGAAPAEEVLAWASTRLSDAEEEDGNTSSLPEGTLTTDLNLQQLDGVYYCLTLLWRLDGHTDRPIAVLALGSALGPPAVPSSAVLRVMGERLHADSPNKSHRSNSSPNLRSCPVGPK
jgi:tRNA A-37 threonylcarbamoyl transferase component Bud32